MANIRSIENYENEIWDFSIFNDCYKGTKIRCADIDGLTERNGFFSIKEFKRPGATVPLGQKITLDKLYKDGNNKTIIVIYGYAEGSRVHEIEVRSNFIQLNMPRHVANLERLKEIETMWFELANSIKHSSVDVSFLNKKINELEIHNSSLIDINKTLNKAIDENNGVLKGIKGMSEYLVNRLGGKIDWIKKQ
jgi:hypothetical protein